LPNEKRATAAKKAATDAVAYKSFLLALNKGAR